MKNGFKYIAALCMAFSGMFGTTAMVNHVAANTATQCGCGSSSCDGGCRVTRRVRPCRSCDTQCGGVECPQCDGEICRLELDNSKVKKTCFKTEQKAVCIPPVRFPWMKDCPPGTSKTRTVTVLKTHSFECPNCAYKWKLQEPEVFAPSIAPTIAPTTSGSLQPHQVPIYSTSPATSSYQGVPNGQFYQSAPVVQPWNANAVRSAGQRLPTSGR